MEYTFRPAVGDDLVLPSGQAGLTSINLMSEDGSTVLINRDLFGGLHRYISGSVSIEGTSGSDTLIASADNDIIFWDPTTVLQVVSPRDFVSPLRNNPDKSIDVFLMGDGNDILTLAHNVANPNNPGLYEQNATAYGGNGNDILWMAAGNDVVYGDAGDDLIHGAGGDDTLYGGAGLDTLFGGSGNDTLYYSSDVGQGANPLAINVWTGIGANPSFTHSIAGGTGYNWSFDLFDGGSGTDTLVLSSSSDILLLNTGDLSVNGVGQTNNGAHVVDIEAIFGGAGNDVIVLNDSQGASSYGVNVTIVGGTGGDLIVSGAGKDLIVGGNLAGAMGGGNANTLYGGAGDDTIYGESMDSPQTSTAGASDTIYGGSGNDVLYGGGGTDTLYGGMDNDTLFGGAAGDSLFGGNGDDTLFGDAGADAMFGGAGNDVMMFSADADQAFDDLLFAWDGNDNVPLIEIDLQAGTILSLDSFHGGDGFDTIDLRGVSTPGARVLFGIPAGGLMVNHLTGIEMIVAGAGADIINLSHIQNDDFVAYASNITIVGGQGDDIVVSGSGNDVIYGDFAAGTVSPGDGDDILYGGAGNDVIYGGSVGGQTGPGLAGNDTLYGGLGRDTLYGGGGDDVIYDVDGGSRIFGGAGSDTIFINNYTTEADNFVIAGSESPDDGNDFVLVYGAYDITYAELGAGDDTYIGLGRDPDGEDGPTGARQDIVYGGTGNDVISAWYGDDRVYGGDGDDALWGGAGNDTIYGGPGSDYLYAGAGNGDVMYGGAGIDYYYWARIYGEGDQIYDEARLGLVEQSENYLVVYSGFDENNEMTPGDGVFEADGILTNNDGGDMVWVYDLDGDGPGTMWRLEILDGEGAGNYIDFDQRDITGIALWNHDATPGNPVIQLYQWDGVTYSLV